MARHWQVIEEQARGVADKSLFRCRLVSYRSLLIRVVRPRETTPTVAPPGLQTQSLGHGAALCMQGYPSISDPKLPASH